MRIISSISNGQSPRSVVLIRLMVGGVFLGEGVLKFLYPAEFGSGRFVTIGIPAPDFFGPFVSSVETIGGVLVIVGLLTRLAATPLLIDISVAILSKKSRFCSATASGHSHWRNCRATVS